ncbi:MAG: helix-turn-helix transcriptional regulator [Nitrospira sp.]
MARRALSSLSKMVNVRRGDNKLRETAKEIGISPATLMRIEGGRIPDVATFGKVCHWLGVEPGEFLGFDVKTPSTSDCVSVSAHFKGDSTPDPDTANALGKMILFALKMQPHSKTVLDNGNI